MYKRHTQGKQPKFNQIPTERLLDQTDKQSKRITDALKSVSYTHLRAHET